MKICSFDENGALRSTEQPEEELERVGALQAFREGEAAFLGGRWVFPEVLRTLRGETPIETVRFWQGFEPASGGPGSCDVFYLNVRSRDDDQLIKRAVHAVVRKGIELNMAGKTGRIG